VIVVAVGAAMPKSPKTGVWFLALVVLVYFLLYFGYFTIFEIIWNGQTPGKKKEGLRVIKDSGRPITPAESVGRNLLRIVDQLPAFYAVGIGSVLLSRQNKRLGDFVAGTIVVHEKPLLEAKPVWQSTEAGQAPPATTYGSERLTPEEFSLIEAFLNRRSSLPPDVRFNMADQIARQIRPKLSLPPGELLYAEKLLEAIAHERAFQRWLLLICLVRRLQLPAAAPVQYTDGSFLTDMSVLQSLIDTIPSLFYLKVSW